MLESAAKFLSAREIGALAGESENPTWAQPFLIRLTKAGLLEMNTKGEFRLRSSERVHLAPNIAEIRSSTFWAVAFSPVGDADGDGVPNDRDQCPNTPPDEIVNAYGCSITQLVPCEGHWKNHGQYVSAMIKTAEEFLKAGLISEEQKRAYIRAAANSKCGQ